MTLSNKHLHPETRTVILGIDVGTSGIRAALVDQNSRSLLSEYSVPMDLPERQHPNSQQAPEVWISALTSLLSQIHTDAWMPRIEHVIIDATSSSVCLIDKQGTPLTPALMYDDKRAQDAAKKIQQIAPQNSGAHGASSTLAKVFWLLENTNLETLSEVAICHQADFVSGFFCGRYNVTDTNNALKLGYDPEQLCWPDWLKKHLPIDLPDVVFPGDVLGQISPGLVKKYGFLATTIVHAGTTDSIAAFLASGAHQIGDAVTSLGSTLALKLLSDQPIFAPEYGIYSHRLGQQWLVGGASNTGGAVLLKHFPLAQLKTAITRIPKPIIPTGLNYYPLMTPGERFPYADPTMPVKLTPEASSETVFLQALIEGLVAIEHLGYERLTALGAPKVQRIFTAGGGIKNTVWMEIRQSTLGAPLCEAQHTDAAFGVTQLIQSIDTTQTQP